MLQTSCTSVPVLLLLHLSGLVCQFKRHSSQISVAMLDAVPQVLPHVVFIRCSSYCSVTCFIIVVDSEYESRKTVSVGFLSKNFPNVGQ
jgi:hypothetical protein